MLVIPVNTYSAESDGPIIATVLSLILMERPSSLTPEKIHDEKVIVLKNLEVLSAGHHLLGQYKSYASELKKAGLINNKIETFLFQRFGDGFATARNTGDSGRVRKIQSHVLVQQRFVEPTVFGKCERIVQTRDEENIVDLMAREVLELLKAVPVTVLEIQQVVFLHRLTPVRLMLPTIIGNGVEIFHSVLSA